MTVSPDSEEAHTDTVGIMVARMESYLDALEDEQDVVEQMVRDLQDHPDDEALTLEEYRQIYPATMPLEGWSFDG